MQSDLVPVLDHAHDDPPEVLRPHPEEHEDAEAHPREQEGVDGPEVGHLAVGIPQVGGCREAPGEGVDEDEDGEAGAEGGELVDDALSAGARGGDVAHDDERGQQGGLVEIYIFNSSLGLLMATTIYTVPFPILQEDKWAGHCFTFYLLLTTATVVTW